jgi:tetratricopeptide (TPR) repeat protein
VVAVAPTSAVREPSPSSLPSPAKADIDPSGKVPPPTGTAGITPAPPVEAAAPRAVAKDGAPEVVQQPPPFERARTALAAGAPDDAIAVLRPIAAKDSDEARALLADALVASGWSDVRRYRWNVANRKAREAMDLIPAGRGHGAHALMGETLYAFHDFSGALNEFTKALAESPRDMRLKRRVIRSLRQLRAPPASASEPAAEPKVEPPSAAAAEPTPEQ